MNPPGAVGGIRLLLLLMVVLFASASRRLRVGQLIIVTGALGNSASETVAMLYPGMTADSAALPAAIDWPVAGH